MHAALSLIHQAEDKFISQEFLSAAERFRQSSAIFPSIYAEYGIAVCHLAVKDYSKAIGICEKYLDVDSMFLDKLKIVVFKAYEGLGELGRSREALESILKTSANETIKDYAGKHLDKIEKLMRAGEEYNKVFSIRYLYSDVCYLVSKEWFVSWENSILSYAPSPGKIANSSLVCKTTKDPRPYASVTIHPHMQEVEHFESLSKPAYLYLKGLYDSDCDIQRLAYKSNKSIELEISLQQIQVLLCPQVSPTYTDKFEILYSTCESLQEIICTCKKTIEADFNSLEYNFDEFKVWKLPTSTKIDTTSPKIVLPTAELLSAFDRSQVSSYIYILEFQKNNGNWTIKTQSEEICPYCSLITELETTCANCKNIRYCSEECMNLHSMVHSSVCNKLTIRFGKTGLKNLGNTCYMNSVLQCLSHIPLLTEYFISKKYLQDSQTPGILTQSYIILLFRLWGMNIGFISPSDFRKNLCIKFPHFSGFAQQDSHEILVSILNGLHDELKSKTTTDPSDSQITIFFKQNLSIIGQSFFGIFFTSVTCPNCRFVSELYEPFITIPLQVMNEERVQLTLYIVLMGNQAKTVRKIISCYYSWGCEMLENWLEKEFGVRFLICFYEGNDYRGVTRNGDIGDYQGKVLVAFESLGNKYWVTTGMVGKGKIGFDRLVFVSEYRNSQEMVEGLIQIYGSAVKSYNCEDFLRKCSVKILNKQGENAEVPNDKAEDKDYYIGLRVVVEFNELVDLGVIKNTIDQQVLFIETPLDCNILSSFRRFTHTETLDEGNKWLCSGCKMNTLALKNTHIVHFPKVLIVHMLKFKNSLSKINTFVEFPVETLDLTEFGGDKKYELRGVVNHYGTYAFGHYTAYVKSHSGEWMEMNDSIIGPISKDSIVTSAAYLLFYVQKP